MTIFSVEKLAELCKVDQETVRRWRNRGVNGVKLEARQSVARRGAALLFDDSAVKAFMEANPKYLTKELSDALDPPETPATAAYRMASVPAEGGDGFVEQMLERQREELLQKVQEIDRTLALLKEEKRSEE